METKQIQNFLNSYSVKMIIVTGLAIVLLIPSILIQELIRERITLSEQVKQELYAQWGGKQVVAGPVLNVPFTVQVQNGSTYYWRVWPYMFNFQKINIGCLQRNFSAVANVENSFPYVANFQKFESGWITSGTNAKHKSNQQNKNPF